MSWLALRVEPASRRHAALGALFDAGAQGVQEEGEALLTYFPAETDLGPVQSAIDAADPGARVTVSVAPLTDWSEAWRSRLSTHQVGTLVIAPPWLADGLDPAHTIVIDPEMAFGTGEHATTRAAIRLMEPLLRAGDRVADLGAGSAVLSIGAAKLGAGRATAIELDGDAIGNARSNVIRNGVADRVHVLEGDAFVLVPLVAPVELVLANIISSVLIELLPLIEGALVHGGHAVLAGILAEEQDAMRRAFADRGWKVVAHDLEDGWWSAAIARR